LIKQEPYLFVQGSAFAFGEQEEQEPKEDMLNIHARLAILLTFWIDAALP
jgi:hypothetical protein